MTRKMIVGIVGGSRRPAAIPPNEWAGNLELAIEAGKMIAGCNCAILTGATVGNGTGRVNGNAMRAAVANGGFAIGILPKSGRQQAREASVVYDSAKGVLEVRTNLSSGRRNYINGVTPDVMIALPGGSGTAAEVKIAISEGRPVIFLNSRESLGNLSTDAVTNKLDKVNGGVRKYIDVKDVMRQDLAGFECNDTDAVRAKILELQSVFRNDTTFYPREVEGAPCKDQFENEFSKYTEGS